MSIYYLKGDATKPVGPGEKYIAHICNDIGKWGAGFVMALSDKWSMPEREFKRAKLRLGDVQFCLVKSDITVVNMKIILSWVWMVTILST